MFGALTLAIADSGRRFSEQDLAIAEDLARRAALAIDNARLYDVEHDIAHTLQQSLLPGTLTQPPGIEIAARYRPAGEGAEVGGDFYDAWQTGERLLPRDRRRRRPRPRGGCADEPDAPGDARRQRATSSRRAASSRSSNDTILAQTAPSEFCTAALAVLRPADDGYALTVSCAGHAPPVVVRAGRRRRGGRHLRAAARRRCRSATFHDTESTLALGDLVAFWTDGVTERRHDGELFGEERLRGAARAASPTASADDVARAIDEAVVDFAPGLPDDDVAILIARVTALPVASETPERECVSPGPRMPS